jgi:DNA invertase Pin-like site-specific DNA recombinase
LGTRLDLFFLVGFSPRAFLVAHGSLMLVMLGGLAEFERELIKARTG